MGRRFIATSTFAVFIAHTSAANAASLQITQGEVLLSRGAGFHAIRNSVELHVGDTVVSRPGSAARVSFADGCSVPLHMGMVFTVTVTSPCEPGAGGEASQAGSADLPESDETLNSTDSWDAGTQTFAATDDAPTKIWPYVLGAAAAGGIAAAASTLGGGDNGSPVSP